MNALPTSLHETLTQILGAAPQSAHHLSGGMINHAARVETAHGTLVVKWSAGAAPGFFAAEADGLERLRAAGALRVPQILAVFDAPASVPRRDSPEQSLLLFRHSS